MTCFVGAVNILCIVFQVAFCNYLYVGGMVDNYGYFFGESPPEVKAMVKEKLKVFCDETNYFTSCICCVAIALMTMKEIFQKVQLVSVDSHSCPYSKTLVYIQISVAIICSYVASSYIVSQVKPMD